MQKTLAYFMANDDEKALLERIFDIIALKISEYDHSRLKNYARTMIGVDLSLQIEKWIAEKKLAHDAVEANKILGVVKVHEDDILKLLLAYPTYFSERIKWISKD